MAKQELTRPKELSVETTAPDVSKTFTYWLRTVNDYSDYLGEGRAEDAPAINREMILISCLSPSVYPLVEEDETFEQIVVTLKAAYIKKKNNAIPTAAWHTRLYRLSVFALLNTDNKKQM